jgi:hypothetical protein
LSNSPNHAKIILLFLFLTVIHIACKRAHL